MTPLHAIGGTPIVELQRLRPDNAARIVVKLEYLNPTGSYKDRMALAMIEEAERRGDLKPGATVVEYTGGSTGSSLAFVCAIKGYRLKVVTSDAFASEKLRTMAAFGADLEIIPSKNGSITRELINRMREKAKEIAEEHDAYFTNQFENRDALVGYEGIGRELTEQLDGEISRFCGAVGTAGMLMGVARQLRRDRPACKITALEPASSPILSEGKSGAHRIEGIGVGFIPPMLDPEHYDEAMAVAEPEARETARRLAAEEGIFVGTSSGLNVAGAIELARQQDPTDTVATVAVDFGLKYLNGDLFNR